jgi:hypothetical protein
LVNEVRGICSFQLAFRILMTPAGKTRLFGSSSLFEAVVGGAWMGNMQDLWCMGIARSGQERLRKCISDCREGRLRRVEVGVKVVGVSGVMHVSQVYVITGWSGRKMAGEWGCIRAE